MTNKEAISILAAATEPQVQGKLSRADYARIQEALILLQGLIADVKDESN
jgi:hypothetical protein